MPDPKQFAQEAFQDQYPGAFSATDIHATMYLPGGEIRKLGNLAALSVSTHRDAFPVTSIGYVAPRGFTRGHRTVAGTLLFHTLDRGALQYGGNPQAAHRSRNGGAKVFGDPLPDQLPLFDIHLTYVNEVGMLSLERIFGVAVLDFGKTVSLENLHPLEQYSYMALDYAPMQSLLSPKPQPVRIEPTTQQRRAPRVFGKEDTQYGPLSSLEETLPDYAEQFRREAEAYLRRLRGDG